MSALTHRINGADAALAALTPTTRERVLDGVLPVLATPVAVAAGVTAALGAAGVGYAVEEAADS